MTTRQTVRLHALEPATYRSPLEVRLQGNAAPRVPMPVYLVEHGDGLVMVDGGLDPAAAGDPASVYGEMAERIDLRFAEHQRVDAQLEALGFSLRDVTHVVATHLHFDHAGAFKQVPHATTFVGTEELVYARNPERFARTWYRPDDFDDRHGIRWRELPCDHDVFGDGALTVLHLPGHSPGSLAVLVRLSGRTIVLSGDVVHTRAAFENEAAYVGDVDTVAARRSLRKLAHVLESTGADLWIAHDPVDWRRFGGAGTVSDR